MTTLGDIITRTRRKLMTTRREPINKLAAPVQWDDGKITLEFDAAGLDRGSRLSVCCEDMHVWAVGGTTAGSEITVERGIDGSYPADHPAGMLVHIDPTWSNWDIGQAVNEELEALSAPTAGLFRVGTAEFQFNPARSGYGIDAPGLIQVTKVVYETAGPADDWPVLPRTFWRVDQNADPSFGGVQLVLKAGGEPGRRVRVTYRQRFGRVHGWDADITEATGLHREAHDILVLGAAIRLIGGLESQRVYTTGQPDPRRAEDVPARASISAVVPLLEQYERRIAEEAARLLAMGF